MNDQEIRIQAMLNTITDLVKEALALHIQGAEQAAAETAEDDEENDKPVTAKIGLTIQWPAGAPEPEIDIKSTYGTRRSVKLSAKAVSAKPETL